MGLDPETAALLREVAARKDAAVADEDFGLAKRLKALQDSIRGVGGTLARLVEQKARAVAAEDYDAAGSLKDEIHRIRSTLTRQLGELGITAAPPVGLLAGGGGGAVSSSFQQPSRIPRVEAAPPLPAAAVVAAVAAAPPSRGSDAAKVSASSSSAYGGSAQQPAARQRQPLPHQQQPAPVAEPADRPIRPAARGAYSLAGGGSGGADGEGAADGPHAYASVPTTGPRPVSRAIRPAPANALDIALAAAEGRAPPAPEPAATPVDDGAVSPSSTSAAALRPAAAAAAAPSAGDERPLSGSAATAAALPSEHPPPAAAGGDTPLPEPEPLSPVAERELGPLVPAFGEHTVRCVGSRSWQLREAGVTRLAAQVGPVLSAAPDALPLASVLLNLAANIAAHDKIAHVFVAAAGKLLPALLAACPRPVLRALVGHGSALEALAMDLLERKLGDNVARVREAAVGAVLELASCDAIGPAYIVHRVVGSRAGRAGAASGAAAAAGGGAAAGKGAAAKGAAAVAASAAASNTGGGGLNLRALQTRLELLTALVEQAPRLLSSTTSSSAAASLHASPTAGGAGGSGATVPVDSLVRYCADLGTFSHASGDIRRATEELMAATHKRVVADGLGPPDAVLARVAPFLRPKQLQEYQAAFAAAKPAASAASAPAPQQPAPPQRAAPPPPQQPPAAAAAAPAAAAPLPAAAAPAPAPAPAGVGQGGGATDADAYDDDGAPPPFPDGVCQFCGAFGPSPSEEALDLHYWQDCPMLMPCGRCGQVIEIASSPEHLLTECEHRGAFTACAVCGDAVPSASLPAHRASSVCRPLPPPEAGSRCPLCRADLPPGTDAWMAHQLAGAGCAANPRSRRHVQQQAARGGAGRA